MPGPGHILTIKVVTLAKVCEHRVAREACVRTPRAYMRALVRAFVRTEKYHTHLTTPARTHAHTRTRTRSQVFYFGKKKYGA